MHNTISINRADGRTFRDVTGGTVPFIDGTVKRSTSGHAQRKQRE